MAFFLVFVAGGAAAKDEPARSNKATHARASADYNQSAVARSKACGPVNSKTMVYEVKDYWHGLTQCMRQLRDVWNHGGPDTLRTISGKKVRIQDLVRNQIVSELQKPYVRFYSNKDKGNAKGLTYAEVVDAEFKIKPGIERVALTNSIGVPYNGMGQSGMAYFLSQFARLSKKAGGEIGMRDAAFYRSIAMLSVNTLLTDTTEGGLATSVKCDKSPELQCTWFHSVTRRDLPSIAGGTLNQNLHVVRDLGLIADSMNDTSTEKKRINNAVRAGVNQLVFSNGHVGANTSPNFADFLSAPVGIGKVHWLYYGVRVDNDKKGGYFLNSKGKDCGYQMHVLDLLSSILARAEKLNELPDEFKSCSASAASAYQTILAVDATPNVQKNWSANDGRDYQCNDVTRKATRKSKFLNKLYGSCAWNESLDKELTKSPSGP
ncbi:hypothetical protein [Bordetella tumulicola]|uniref:hypothetical protein n=1 Tax=Bordetella tumulicola TaxID=1649133 RepID=UPI0039F0B022